jgi:hypothetical protein
MKLLTENGKGCFIRTTDREIARDIKEKCSYIALDYDDECRNFLNSNQSIDYELPDGTIISIGEERFKCTELLFRPALIGIIAMMRSYWIRDDKN